MIMVIWIIYAEGHFGKVGYRNVAQARIPGVGYVRIQAISYLSFYKGKGAFKTVGDKSLLRRQSHENIILYCKNRIRKLPGGAGNKIPLQLSLGQGFILGQEMIGRADTGYRGRSKFFVPQRRCLLPIFYAQSRQKLSVFHHSQDRWERDQADGRTEQGKFLRQFLQNGREKVHFCVIMTSQIKWGIKDAL